jgi:hypothetical protein
MVGDVNEDVVSDTVENQKLANKIRFPDNCALT